MIEIKKTRYLHSSGYRQMEVSLDGKVLTEGADNISFKCGKADLHIDITKEGVIRIWSNFCQIKNKTFGVSDANFELVKEAEDGNKK